VAFATPRTHNGHPEDTRIITDWGPQMGNEYKVPSVISYSPPSSAGEQQWGYSLSVDAVAIVNTKLELDGQDSRSDELDLILKVLDGMQNLHFGAIVKTNGYPEYTWKTPEDIVTDYLGKVFLYVDHSFDWLDSHLRTLMLVDIAITVPAVSALFLSFNCSILTAVEELVIPG
jgi:hypothetical protein